MLSENGLSKCFSLKRSLLLAVFAIGFTTAQATTIIDAENEQLTILQKTVAATTNLSNLSANQTEAIFKVIINVIGLNTQAEHSKKNRCGQRQY